VFSTRCLCPGAMLLLLEAHSFDDGAAPGVARRQAVEMSFQMFCYLAFCFLHEPQRPAITNRSAGCSSGKCAGIPERPESARCCAKFFEALFAPAQVIEFFRGRFTHVIDYGLTSCDRRVALVQPLSGNFTRMIDTHESGCM